MAMGPRCEHQQVSSSVWDGKTRTGSSDRLELAIGKRRPGKLGRVASRNQDTRRQALSARQRIIQAPRQITLVKEDEVGIRPEDARQLDPLTPGCKSDCLHKTELRKYQLTRRGSLRVEPEHQMSQAREQSVGCRKRAQGRTGNQTRAQRFA